MIATLAECVCAQIYSAVNGRHGFGFVFVFTSKISLDVKLVPFKSRVMAQVAMCSYLCLIQSLPGSGCGRMKEGFKGNAKP